MKYKNALIYLFLIIFNSLNLFSQNLEKVFSKALAGANANPITVMTNDNKFIIGGCYAFIHVWDAETGILKISYKSSLLKASLFDISSNGKYSIFQGSDSFELLDNFNLQRILRTKCITTPRPNLNFRNYTFSSDGDLFAYLTYDSLIILNLDTKETRKFLLNNRYYVLNINKEKDKILLSDGIILSEFSLSILNFVQIPHKQKNIVDICYDINDNIWIYGITPNKQTPWVALFLTQKKEKVSGKWKIFDAWINTSTSSKEYDDIFLNSKLVFVRREFSPATTQPNAYLNPNNGKIVLSSQKQFYNSNQIVSSSFSKGSYFGIGKLKGLNIYYSDSGDWILHYNNFFSASETFLENLCVRKNLFNEYKPALLSNSITESNEYNINERIRVLQDFIIYNPTNFRLLSLFKSFPIAEMQLYTKTKPKVFMLNSNWYSDSLFFFRDDYKTVIVILNQINKDEFEGYYLKENGDLFGGIFKNGSIRNGVFISSSGDNSWGEFENELLKKGGVIFKNKDMLVGSFLNKKLHGDNCLSYYKDSSCLYKGRFENGSIIRGTVIYSNGDSATASFYNKKIEGDATYYFTDGKVFKGQFKSNKFNGKGKLTFLNGDYYEGEFINSQYNGKGVLNRISLLQRYEGEFKNGQPHGNGIYMENNQPERCEFYEGKRIDQAYLIRQENRRAELVRENERLAEQERQRKVQQQMDEEEESAKGAVSFAKALLFATPLVSLKIAGASNKELAQTALSSLQDVYINNDPTMSSTMSTISSFGSKNSQNTSTNTTGSDGQKQFTDAELRAACAKCQSEAIYFTNILNSETENLQKIMQGGNYESAGRESDEGAYTQLCGNCAQLALLVCQYDSYMRLGALSNAKTLIPNIQRQQKYIKGVLIDGKHPIPCDKKCIGLRDRNF